MKLAVITVAVVIVALIAAAYSRRSARISPTRSFIVTLPVGWYEVPGESPRAYRRKTDGSGILQISLQPPIEHHVTTGEDAERELVTLLDGLKMDLGQRLVLAHEQAEAGIVATALHKSEKQGLLQFWLIPTEVTVFASYTMGKLDTAKDELAEAAQIMKTIKLK